MSKQYVKPTHCLNGHEFTADNTAYKSKPRPKTVFGPHARHMEGARSMSWLTKIHRTVHMRLTGIEIARSIHAVHKKQAQHTTGESD